MKQFQIFSLLLVGALANDKNVAQFMEYCSKHGKSYNSLAEFEMRLSMYNKQDAFIRSKMQTNSGGYTLGHNSFSDWTEQEKKQTLGFKESKYARKMAQRHVPSNAAVPAFWDWRQHGLVTAIKDQAACGSCWAFATAASLEGAHAKNTGQLMTFSESQFVACVKNQTAYGYETETPPCCFGCNGGDADASYLWAQTNNISLVKENDWKYAPLNGTCDYESKDHSHVMVDSYYDIPSNQSSLMMDAAAKQPVATNIDATTLHNYMGGILDSTFGCGLTLNHVVTIVGFGVRSSDNMKFWIIKNSWGTEWGENGYFRLQNTDDNSPGVCGVNWKSSYPTTKTTNVNATK